MGFAFIRERDSRVLASAPENKGGGLPLALLGDKVSRPKCGAAYPIAGIKDLSVMFDAQRASRPIQWIPG